MNAGLFPVFLRKRSRGGVDARCFDVVGDGVVELFEVCFEPLCQIAGSIVVTAFVGPGLFRIQNIGRHVRNRVRNQLANE